MSAACVVLACSGSFPGNVRVMMSTVYAAARAYRLPPEWTGMPPAGWLGRHPSTEWTGRIKCWSGTSLVSGVDMAYLMPRRHITCQLWQAARFLRNKCAAQRPYVWLRPLAYVTGSRPRGSTGSPPERGVGALAVWSEYVSAPDPRLALIKAWLFFSLES
jgi:hypothetical protein